MRFVRVFVSVLVLLVVFFLNTSNSFAASYIDKEVDSKVTTESVKSASSLEELKNQIHQAMSKRQTSFTIEYTGNPNKLTENIKKIVEQIFTEDEYLNYDYRSYRYTWKNSGNRAVIDFNVSYFQTKEQLEYVNKRIQEILDDIIDPSMNDHEKVKAVHDYIVLNVKYDTTYNQSHNAAYFALKNGVTMCNGYSMLAYQMLEELGIPVRFISGRAGKENHVWNLVQLDGKWYHLDVTWDDPSPDEPGRVMYDYYLLSDQEIQKDHSWKEGGLNGLNPPYPQANTVYLNELVKLGEMELMENLGLHYLTSDWTVNENQLSSYLKGKLTNQEKSFSFRFVTSRSNEFQQMVSKATNGMRFKNLNWQIAEYQRTPEQDYIVNVTVGY
ncbi:transglutaminase domain-containing protein [Ureibacillus thermophilus]|uniref:transglutaminase domain-containing protein n=1 Tax=Ureibacillus thermophilus TaxID=367743 RepID=UPI00361D342A